MNSTDTRRFGGICRLYSKAGFEKLRRAHVCVVGLGGVGSWCAEALARTGVGRLTLIDADTVAESNINRQLPALTSSIGRPKVEILADRFADINPVVELTLRQVFVEARNFEEVIPADAILVDAIDSLSAKAELIAWAHAARRTIVVSGGAGGRTDPSQITVSDLALVSGDALLAKLRTRLRKEFGCPAGANDPKRTRAFGIAAVYSRQKGRPCAADAIEDAGADAGFGTAVVVTASVGLRLASEVIDRIVGKEPHGCCHTFFLPYKYAIAAGAPIVALCGA